MIEHYDLGEANLHVRVCFSRLRFVTCLLKDELRRDGLWDDLIQELYTTALEAHQHRMNEHETYRYAGRRIYAFLKACGYRMYRGAYIRPEKPFALVFKDIDNIDEILQPLESPARPYFSSSNLGERIMNIIRRAAEGMKKSELCGRLQISVQELEWHLSPLLKSQRIIEVKRVNWLGRPLRTLLVIAGAPIPEGKSIKRIAREYHHDKRTVRKVVYASPVPS